uniref:IGF-like family receptor 1 n=1 Tax=Xiphophorus couchianus TaxID=32473 RepID=A0A3B5KNN2_9TELE
MALSGNCKDPTTFWNRSTRQCDPCGKKAGMHNLYYIILYYIILYYIILYYIILYHAGYEVEPNCGRDDKGGFHSDTHKECKPNTFNDGSQDYCQQCSTCSPDTYVRKTWTVPIIIVLLLFAGLFALMMKKRRGMQCELLTFFMDTHGNLDADILSAPLHKVLDDLDVLEELVILLDPDTQGIKSTKHLASHCSFTSTWITYTYSMKDTKSPLKAVLEGVTSKQPDWTVANLAKLLRQMNRNDAISVLAKLRPEPVPKTSQE